MGVLFSHVKCQMFRLFLFLPGRVPMRQLVYRVQPLPQSMLPLVWDFGQLDTDTECLYIRQMVLRYVCWPCLCQNLTVSLSLSVSVCQPVCLSVCSLKSSTFLNQFIVLSTYFYEGFHCMYYNQCT